MSPRPSPISTPARLGLLLFVALPCLPGIIFLLAGLLSDPHRLARSLPPLDQAQFDHLWERTRELYLAGAIVLMGGTLCAAFVVWKIARPGLPPEDEEPEAHAGDEQI